MIKPYVEQEPDVATTDAVGFLQGGYVAVLIEVVQIYEIGQ